MESITLGDVLKFCNFNGYSVVALDKHVIFEVVRTDLSAFAAEPREKLLGRFLTVGAAVRCAGAVDKKRFMVNVVDREVKLISFCDEKENFVTHYCLGEQVHSSAPERDKLDAVMSKLSKDEIDLLRTQGLKL